MIREPSRIGRVATPIRLHAHITLQSTFSSSPDDRLLRPTTVVCPSPILMLPSNVRCSVLLTVLGARYAVVAEPIQRCGYIGQSHRFP